MSDQATRDNKDKLDFTILPWEAFEEVIKAFKQGEKDYGRNNYKKGEGLSLESYRQSMFRHLIASEKGIEFDEKSGADHIGHLAANCLMYLWQKQHQKGLDEWVEVMEAIKRQMAEISGIPASAMTEAKKGVLEQLTLAATKEEPAQRLGEPLNLIQKW